MAETHASHRPSVEARGLAREQGSEQSHEAARLYVLHGYQVLDTPAEARFDRVTRLLARELEVPIALISLVDAERQWFKSRLGLDAESTPREFAFCAHAIASDDVMVVEDARLDQRFVHNPLVEGAPHIRFYAGAPLLAPGGNRLGTLCAIDSRPRSLNREQRELLRELSEHVMDLLELRRLGSLRNDVEETVQALAYDLRPSLHQVATFAELVQNDPSSQLGPKSQKHLRLVQDVSERIRMRLEAVRDFLKSSEPQEAQPIQTGRLVAEVVTKLEEPIAAKRAEVLVEPLAPVLGQRAQVEALFSHLLDNALKYAGPGPVRVVVRCAQQGDRVLFEVADNGPGIPNGQRGRALRLFQRLHSGEVPGVGAGLSLCRRIVESSGGRLLIDSAAEGGAAIRFSLPAAGSLAGDSGKAPTRSR
jgi:signal transduction histidine kinase